MAGIEDHGTARPGGASPGRISSASEQAARDRGRLRASEEAVTAGVIEFQLARQRLGVAPPEIVVPLSPRELEVVVLVASGMSDGEIADQLVISKKTASVHVANIKGKLGAGSRVEIAMLAAQMGLAGDGAGSERPAGEAPRAPRQVVLCPFKGLAAFEASDAAYFFGRERLVAELTARIVGATFLGVVGASGTGKSSAIRAGLIPALRDGVLPGSEGWPIAVLRPGPAPTASLARAVRRAVRGDGADGDGPEVAGTGLVPADVLDRLPDATRLVVVVDQFEELFAEGIDEADRAAFVQVLAAFAGDAEQRAVVIVAVRADVYGRCADDRVLVGLLGANTLLVGPLAPRELARAIELPARAVRLRVEPALLTALVDDVIDQPGGLPLLSTTLLELWQVRTERTLRLDAYREIGGVSGAVARLAESAYARLGTARQPLARSVFLRLAQPMDGGPVIGRRVPLRDLDADREGPGAEVVDLLVEARLLTVDDDAVEVSHEALLREWPRMRAWLDEDAEGRRVRDHLAQAARGWDAAGHDDAELYRGSRLSAALEWIDGHGEQVNDLERRFLESSRAAAEQAADRERRTNTRLGRMVAVAAALLAIALVAAVVAWVQRGDAQEQAAAAAAGEAKANQAQLDAEAAGRDAVAAGQDAAAAARFARSRELAASAAAVLGDDPALSKLLALAAADVGPHDATIDLALHRAWLADRIVDRTAIPGGEPLDEPFADVHPGGGLAVLSGPGLAVMDLETDEVAWRYEPENESVVVDPAWFSTDGRTVIAGTWLDGDASTGVAMDGLGILVFDAQTGELLDRIDTGPCGAWLSGRSADTVLAHPEGVPFEGVPACVPGRLHPALEAIDLASGRRTRIADRTFGDGAISRDGTRIGYTDAETQRYTVIDTATGRTVRSMPIEDVAQDDRFVRALSADGSLLAVGDRPIRVIDVATGAIGAPLSPGTGESAGVTFGPDGTTLYATGRDARLRAWEAASGVPLVTLPAIGGRFASITSDGRILVDDVEGRAVVLVEPEPRGELGTVRTCHGFAGSGSLEVVNALGAVSVECGRKMTYVFDAATGRVQLAIPDPDGQDLGLSDDGTRLVRQVGTGGVTGALQVLDTATGEVVASMHGLCEWDATASVPRTEAGPCAPFPETPFGIWNAAMALSPDGSLLAAIDQRERWVAVWDASSGRLVHTSAPDLGASSILFTPDSRELIVATLDGELVAHATDGWGVTRRASIDPGVAGAGTIGLIGYRLDGASVIAVSSLFGGGGSLVSIDARTLDVLRSQRIHEGQPKDATLSPDGSLIATGASDGVVRVWDAETWELRNELAVDGQAQGVAFAGADRLAVVPQRGDVLVMALDGPELLETVRASLTRSLTPEECVRHGFGEACPGP